MKNFKYIFMIVLTLFLFMHISCNDPKQPMMDSNGILNSLHIGWTKPDCKTCHSYISLQSRVIHKDLFSNGKDAYELCSLCHGTNGVMVDDNITTEDSLAISDCKTCHNPTVEVAIATNKKFLLTHINGMQNDQSKCATCHIMNDHKGIPKFKDNMDCLACHDKTNGVSAYNHVPKGECFTCHVADGLIGKGGNLRHKINYIKSDSCVSCHNRTSVYAVKLNTIFIATHPLSIQKSADYNCLTCHNISGHPSRRTSFNITAFNDECIICHDGSTAISYHRPARDKCTGAGCHTFVGLKRLNTTSEVLAGHLQKR